MTIDPWMIFWGTLLGVTLLAYACLAVVVTIGGFRDILSMFGKLDRAHREEELEAAEAEEATSPRHDADE